MKIYSAHGVNEFIVCCGYKGYMIKEFFANYLLHSSDVTIDIKNDKIEIHENAAEPWRVTLVDTGEHTGTGGRIKRVSQYLGDETFLMTYGDGVSNVDITQLVAFHREQNKLATLTAVQPPGRFGAFGLSGDGKSIAHFREKPKGDGAWVNGGFFVLEAGVIDYIDNDGIFWEAEPLSKLAEDNQLCAYKHEDYWQSMDTLRDRNVLEKLWVQDKAPWKTWPK